MILLEPVDKGGNANGNRSRRGKPHIALDGGDIGGGFLDVARLHGLELIHSLLAQRSLDQANEIHQPLGSVITDVIKIIGRLAPVIGGRIVENPDHARDDVFDEGEVTPHVAIMNTLMGSPATMALANR